FDLEPKSGSAYLSDHSRSRTRQKFFETLVEGSTGARHRVASSGDDCTFGVKFPLEDIADRLGYGTVASGGDKFWEGGSPERTQRNVCLVRIACRHRREYALLNVGRQRVG